VGLGGGKFLFRPSLLDFPLLEDENILVLFVVLLDLEVERMEALDAFDAERMEALDLPW